MKIKQEAIVGDYHFTVGEDYLAITKSGEEMVHITKEEAMEVVGWLHGQLYHEVAKRVLPEFMAVRGEQYPALNKPVTSKDQGKVYTGGAVPLENRRIPKEQIAKIEVGDPFLANSAPTASGDGKQRIVGIEINDLGEQAKAAGLPFIRK